MQQNSCIKKKKKENSLFKYQFISVRQNKRESQRTEIKPKRKKKNVKQYDLHINEQYLKSVIAVNPTVYAYINGIDRHQPYKRIQTEQRISDGQLIISILSILCEQ